jgi:hypothetical protein
VSLWFCRVLTVRHELIAADGHSAQGRKQLQQRTLKSCWPRLIESDERLNRYLKQLDDADMITPSARVDNLTKRSPSKSGARVLECRADLESSGDRYH